MDTLGFEEYFIDDYVTDWTLRPNTTEIAQENFTFISKYLNVITVEEKGDNIIISGINSHHFAKDVKKLWQTSRIVQYMFIKLSSREIVLPKFFAVELRYMLVKLVESGQAYSKRTIKTIIEELETKTWLKGVVSPPTEEVFNYDRLRELNVTLLPSQMEFLKLYSDIVPRYGLKGFMLASPPGSGKGQPLYSKVKIPNGWKTMGEIQVGDVVTAYDGSHVKVLGVYPQGKKPLYRLTTSDGRVTYADENHFWMVHDRESKDQWIKVNTVELKRLISMSSKSNRLYLPLVKADNDDDLELPLNPYLLGVLIGDGSIVDSCKITLPDEEIINNVRNIINDTVSLVYYSKFDYHISKKAESKRNYVIDALRELGLLGKRAWEKNIPEIYKNGSTKQRLQLLQGLMDTDGTASTKGGCSYCTTSEVLAKDVQYLVRSLGGMASISVKKEPKYTHNSEKRIGRCAYIVHIRFKVPSSLFTLTRKKMRAGDMNQYSATLKCRIESVEYVGEEETQCILIDHPDHLYITDDFIVTHNTEAGLALSLVSEAAVTIIISPKNAVGEVWQQRIIQRFKHTPSFATSIGKPFTGKEQYYICHYEALDRAIQFADLNKGKKLCILLDESHNLNEIESLRTQKFIDLCKRADVFSVLWASGTPLKAMGSEMVPFLSTIDPLFTADVRARFTQIFGKSVARAVDILANRIGITSYKIAKAAVVELEIDERIEKVSFKGAEQFTLSKIKQEISEFVKERIVYYKENMSRYVSLYNGLIEIYRQTLRNKEDIKALDNYYRDVMHLHKRFDPMRDMDLVRACNRYEERNILPVLKGEQKVQFRDARSVVKYVQLKIRGEALGRILTKRRIECFKAMVEHFDWERIIEASEKKTLIFTSYVDVVDEIADKCFSLEYNPLKVYGDTNKDIEKIMKIYKTDTTANPMVATFDSLSTAIPVIEANTCVLFNSPFRDYERNQATSRVARLGQDSPVHIVTVLLDTGSEDNISTRSNDIMEWSKAQVDAMLGYDQSIDVYED